MFNEAPFWQYHKNLQWFANYINHQSSIKMYVLTQVFLFSNASEVRHGRFIPQYMLCCLNAFITRPHYSQRLIEV